MRDKKIGIIGATALALGSLVGMSAAPSTAQSESTPTSQTTPSKDQVNTIQNDVQSPKPIAIKSGMRIYAGYGIPPHIYGTHYVKRGTHKRTNK